MKIKKIFYHLYSVFYFCFFIFKQKLKYSLDSKHIIYYTSFATKFDGRVKKSVEALLKKGFLVELIKPSDALDDDNSSWHENLKITPLGLSGSYSNFPYICDWKVLRYLFTSKAAKIYCRDIYTGMMGVIAARKTGAESIVDFYEWYSVSKEYDYKNHVTREKSAWKKVLFRFYERYICKHADRLITNNESFARGIAQDSVPMDKFTFIRNIPDNVAIDPTLSLRDFVPENKREKKILYYIGQLSFDRKLETLVKAMKDLDDYILIIQGTGYLEIQKSFSHLLESFEDRILFLPPIPSHEIISYASTADIGVFICDNKDKKMYHALPNKLFEYVFAGIPQLSSEGAEVNKVIGEHRIGMLFDAYDSDSFLRVLSELVSGEKYQEIQKAVLLYKEQLMQEEDYIKI